MDVDYPEHYVCPITLDLMLEPVKASDNNIYDKAAIIDWYKVNKISPLTREQLSPEFVLQNKLKNEINIFIKNFGIKVKPYSPKNIPKKNLKKSERTRHNTQINQENLEQSSETISTFNCSVCSNPIVFNSNSSEINCSRCNKKYCLLNCQDCNHSHILKVTRRGNFRCRNCGTTNMFTSNRMRNECIIS